jgi:Spy/CpxP family protein refolding chaperone
MNRFALRFALLGLALAAAAFVPAGFAQDNGAASSSDSGAVPQHRTPDPQKMAARLARRLGLNDEQSTKIGSILQSRQQQLAAIRSDNSLAPPDRRAKLRAIQQDTDAQIDAVLTPDQQQQYAALKENIKARRQSAHGAANAAGNSGDDSH